jgi:hypothetical protein
MVGDPNRKLGCKRIGVGYLPIDAQFGGPHSAFAARGDDLQIQRYEAVQNAALILRAKLSADVSCDLAPLYCRYTGLTMSQDTGFEDLDYAIRTRLAIDVSKDC